MKRSVLRLSPLKAEEKEKEEELFPKKSIYKKGTIKFSLSEKHTRIGNSHITF